MKGRKIKVEGTTYHWRFSQRRVQMKGASPKTATLTVQHAATHGRLLRVMLTSSNWTPEMDLDDNEQAAHRAVFTPKDVASAIDVGIKAGWTPETKGKDFKLRGHTFTDYHC